MGDSDAAALGMKRHFNKILELLTKVPGPQAETGPNEHDPYSNSGRTIKKKEKKEAKEQEWGIDTFMQDQATHFRWSILIAHENKALRQALVSRNKIMESIDCLKAH